MAAGGRRLFAIQYGRLVRPSELNAARARFDQIPLVRGAFDRVFHDVLKYGKAFFAVVGRRDSNAALAAPDPVEFRPFAELFIIAHRLSPSRDTSRHSLTRTDCKPVRSTKQVLLSPRTGQAQDEPSPFIHDVDGFTGRGSIGQSIKNQIAGHPVSFLA